MTLCPHPTPAQTWGSYCGLTTVGTSKLLQKKSFVIDFLSDLGRREDALEICSIELQLLLRLLTGHAGKRGL